MKKCGLFILLLILPILSINISFAQESAEQTTGTVLAETTAPGVITFSFKDADIRNVLRLISAKSGVNIVYGPDVTGVVNMELKDVPWEQALGLILDLNGYAYQKEGNVIKVLKKEDVSKEPLSTEVFTLNYAVASDAVKSVEQMLTERGSVKTDTRSNTVVVTDVPVNINKIEIVLARLDSRTPQVLIETKIVEMSNAKEKDLGLKWTSLKEYKIGLYDPTRTYESKRTGGREREDIYTTSKTDTSNIEDKIYYYPLEGTGNETITSTATSSASTGRSLLDTFTKSLLNSDIRTAILSAADFELVLSALQTQSDAELISSPKVLTVNNEKAQIKVVDEYPIPKYTFDTSTSTFTISGFDYKDIGVTFDVTPNISSDGYVTMKVDPQVSTYIRDIPFTASGSTVLIPLVAVKKASSKLVIKSGETLAIGGLVNQSNKNTVTKVPILGDIPVLGRLFRHDAEDKEKKDIIFFITATVIDDKTRDLVLQATSSVAKESPEVYKKVFGEPKDVPVIDENVPSPSTQSGGNKGYIKTSNE